MSDYEQHYNFVVLANPLKRKLKVFSMTTIIITICFAVILILFHFEYVRNFGGETRTVNVTVADVTSGANVYNVTDTDGNGYLINMNIVKLTDDTDIAALAGKSVTFVVPLNASGNKNIIVLGAEIDGATVIDYRQTLQTQRQDYALMKTVLIVLVSVAGGLSLALLIWMLCAPSSKLYDLTEKFAEYCALRQPSCPQRRASSAWMIITAILVLVVMCVGITLSETLHREWIMDAVFGVDVILLAAALVIIRLVVARKEREFYRQNYPFDYTDISHLMLRKNIKMQLQEEIRAQRQSNMHRYFDGGNGFEVEFTADGLDLYMPEEEPDEQPAPTAEDVFQLEGDRDESAPTATERAPLRRIDYATCNWVAQAHYRKFDHPFAIVIKTRLPREEMETPVKIVNEIHIPVDTNLLNTLRTFDVQVENLQYLLDNKNQLMDRHCKLGIARKNKSDDK